MVFIVDYGNCTSLGERAGVTAASARAGFAMISLQPKILDDHLEPIRLGLVEYLEEGLSNSEQMLELTLPSLKEAYSLLLEQEITVLEIPVLVGLPEERPGLPPNLKEFLSQSILESGEKDGIRFNIEIIPNGHTACLSAIEKSFELLNQYEFCLVGGIESYNDIETLNWLEMEQKRLFCSYNKNGFIPGQAAGFILLANQSAVENYRLEPRAKILACSSAEEENSIDSKKLSTARALTQTIRQNLKYVDDEAKIDAIYSTINGEDYHAQELAYTIVNVGTRIKEVGNLVAPYDCFGDLGAASVPVYISLMMEAGKKKYAKGPLNLITAASLGNQRASALIQLLNLD